MLSGISLIATLLVLNRASCATDHHSSAATTTQREQWPVTSGREVLRHAYDNVTTSDVSVDIARDGKDDEDTLTFDDDVHGENRPKILLAERDRPRHRRRRFGHGHIHGHGILALLMAYKLKFIALIPVLLGGLILLKGTTLLAGFFFSLFAAVLGLKMH